MPEWLRRRHRRDFILKMIRTGSEQRDYCTKVTRPTFTSDRLELYGFR
jgi:hypothetical protein